MTLSVLNQEPDIKVGFHLNWAFLREMHTDQESSSHPGGPSVSDLVRRCNYVFTEPLLAMHHSQLETI